MPPRGEVDAVGVLNDPEALHAYLSSHHEYFYENDNFQSRYLYELPKLLWQTEKIEDLGDFVLLFPNPDKADETAKNIGITLEDAQDYFRVIFETPYTYPNKKKFMTSLKEAYKTTFEGLKNTKAKGKQIFRGQLYLNPKKEKALKQSSSGASNFTTPRGSVQSPGLSPGISPRSHRFSIASLNSPYQQFGGFTELAMMEPGSPTGKHKELKRHRREEQERHRYMWQRNPEVERTSDYLTLFRKTAAAILANQGFVSREVFLNKGRDIGLVLSLPEDCVKRALLELGVSRVVEPGIADVLALEPVDAKYRPLRLNRILHQEDDWDRHYGLLFQDQGEKLAVMELRQDIVEILEADCDAKHIVRLCGGIWPESPFEGEDPTIYEHEVVPLETWYCYRRFLVELAIQLRLIEANKKKLSAITSSYFEAHGGRRADDSGLQRQKHEARVDIHKFTVREVVKAFREAHSVVRSLVAAGDMAFDHEQASGNIQKKTRLAPLETVWTHLGLEHKEYHMAYRVADNKMRPHSRFFYDSLWKEYLCAPSYETVFEKPTAVALQAFTKVERLKAASYLVR